MSRVVRVRYEKGVLKPLEPLSLREGEQLSVVIRRGRLLELAARLRREARIEIDELIKEVRGRGETMD